MIFRTGSCLIVGNCSEKILRFIFGFVKNVIIEEYETIHVPNQYPIIKNKIIKSKKKELLFTREYYQKISHNA